MLGLYEQYGSLSFLLLFLDAQKHLNDFGLACLIFFFSLCSRVALFPQSSILMAVALYGLLLSLFYDIIKHTQVPVITWFVFSMDILVLAGMVRNQPSVLFCIFIVTFA